MITTCVGNGIEYSDKALDKLRVDGFGEEDDAEDDVDSRFDSKRHDNRLAERVKGERIQRSVGQADVQENAAQDAGKEKGTGSKADLDVEDYGRADREKDGADDAGVCLDVVSLDDALQVGVCSCKFVVAYGMGDGDGNVGPGPRTAHKEEGEELALDDGSEGSFGRLDEAAYEDEERGVAKCALGRIDEEDDHADPGEKSRADDGFELGPSEARRCPADVPRERIKAN